MALALSLGEAEGLAGLERDAVDEDTRLAQAGEDAVGHVARPLRRPSRQDDDVALRKRRADGAFESGLIVRDDAEGHGFAAILGDRSGDDGAVRIVNAGCRQGLARWRQLVAGGEHGDPRPAHHLDRIEAAGGQHADLARGDDGALAENGLAARHVRPRITNELSGRGSPVEVDRQGSFAGRDLGRLHHHHRVGAAWNHAARGDGRRRAGLHRQSGSDAAGEDLVVEAEPGRFGLARAECVGGAECEPIDEGSVEGGHVDGRGNVPRQRAAERCGERHALGWQRHMRHRRAKPRCGLVSADHMEELLLTGRARQPRQEILVRLRCVETLHRGITSIHSPSG